MPASEHSRPADLDDAEAWAPAERRGPLHYADWRRLLPAALLGVVGLLVLLRSLLGQPMLGFDWRVIGDEVVVPTAMMRLAGVAAAPGSLTRVQALHTRDGRTLEVDPLLLRRSPRWIVDDAERAQHRHQHQQLAHALDAGGALGVSFADQQHGTLQVTRRGLGGFGVFFWLSCALALGLYLIAAAILLARPRAINMLYALLCLCQVGSLLCVAVELLPGLGLPPLIVHHGLGLRSAFDFIGAAAVVQLAALYPQPLPRHWRWIAPTWLAALLLAGLALAGRLPQAWWWVQAGLLAAPLAVALQLVRSYRREPRPALLLQQRLAVVAMATLTTLTIGMLATNYLPGGMQQVAAVGAVAWTLFVGCALALLPFVSRSRQPLRELALLAAACTIAVSLTLLLGAVFSLGPFGSIALALLIVVASYAAVRRWLLGETGGSLALTPERTFEQLYRITRELEAEPQRAKQQLARLLEALYEPLEVVQVARRVERSRVVGDGSALLVPLPQWLVASTDDDAAATTVVLRYADRGRRVFTDDDARLTDRLIDQLRRALAFEAAVEQGRNEERLRIAQDLHDDIGARLLTLMYRAADRPTEDYLRLTLKDLKTLTRGLAAGQHQLADAAGEWKADLGQRISEAGLHLVWHAEFDEDLPLSVTQWSALTRVLRELVTNVLVHAAASRIDIALRLAGGRLTLAVGDDGIGADPGAWSHGLGLGGIRKRVRQLGGHVAWQARPQGGIRCDVVIDDLRPGG